MDEMEQDAGFAEFEAGFADEYQVSEPEAENVESEESAENSQDAGEPNEDGETTTEDGKEPEQESGTHSQETPPESQPETFTLRVNKEERNVSREEVITLAQKGADYDRVKGQLSESRSQNQALQEKLDTLEMIANKANMSVDDLVNQLHVNMLVKGGKTEAEAKAEIRALKAEAELKAVRDKETAAKADTESLAARAEREVGEFRKRFPGVELTKELCDALSADVQKGMTISEAYQKREMEQKDAQIAELNRKLAAEKQNRKNKSNTPGSQNDSGGRREKSDFDDFMSAFA